jgi:hypothetical protein
MVIQSWSFRREQDTQVHLALTNSARDPAYLKWKQIEPRYASTLQNYRETYKYLSQFDDSVNNLENGNFYICIKLSSAKSHGRLLYIP